MILISDVSSMDLILNHRKLTNTNKSVTLGSDIFTLCCKSEHYPCNVIIFADGYINVNRSNCYTHTRVQQMNYRLGYFICGSERFSNNIDVLINIDSESSAAEIKTTAILIMVVSVLSIIIVVLIFILVYRWCRESRKDKNNKVSPTAKSYPNEENSSSCYLFESAKSTVSKTRKRKNKKQ
ncbi:hypothetical protein BgiBS90_019181 [Biomphalaria glabrata]|nr:hypothetical protein BgiBS90_019181 [Biomphalaria glabrata]